MHTLSVEVPAGAIGIQLKAGTDGQVYIAATSNDAVPIELSSNLSVAFLTGYLGAALDMNTGVSTGDAALGGAVRGAGVGKLGNASVALNATGSAEPMTPRGFLGGQIKVFMITGYAHLNIGLNQAYGGHIGARLVL